MSPGVEIENKASKLLSSEENSQIFRLLGNRCQTLATTVAQIFLTEPPNHSYWIKKRTGVLCFVKDNIKKNYFFRLFCLRRNNIVWEHKLYNNLELIESKSFFHTFEGQDCLVGIHYESPDEARDMKKIVDLKIYAKRKRDERRQYNIDESNYITINNNFRMSKTENFVNTEQADLATTQTRKQNITKDDVGSPNTGWNPDTGFDIDGINDQLKNFFAKAGISNKELEDEETRKFIYDFINERGGLDAVAKETIERNLDEDNNENGIPTSSVSTLPSIPPRGLRKQHVRAAPPPPPTGGPTVANIQQEQPCLRNSCITSPSAPPPPPPANNAMPPPPPPLNISMDAPRISIPTMGMNSALLQSIREGTTLKRAASPPPPPPCVPSGQPLAKIQQEKLSLVNTCVAIPCAPLPPPPPPSDAMPPPPPPLQISLDAPRTSTPTMGMNSALLQSIREGTNLKPIEDRKVDAPVDSKRNLLLEIKKGIVLKPVKERKVKPSNQPKVPDIGLANALALALRQRLKAQYSDNDASDHDNESNGDEWD